MNAARLAIGIGLWLAAAIGSVAAEPVRYDLSADKERYEVGEPIVVTIRLTNEGDAPFEVPASSERSGRNYHVFDVKNANGDVIQDPLNEYIWMLGSIGSDESLAPGDSYTRKLTLNHRFAVPKPGKYSVQGKLRPRYDRSIAAESAVVTFEIVETPPARLQQRVEGLVQELRGRRSASDRAAAGVHGSLGGGRAAHRYPLSRRRPRQVCRSASAALSGP